MNHSHLPATRETSLATGYSVLVTKNAMRVISDPSTSAVTKRAVESAMEYASGPALASARTVMIQDCPLSVHIDPSRRAVIILSKFPGWPAVTDDLVEELVPFCSSVALA